MEIQVQVRNVYGNDLVYPICRKAELFCFIAGTKTLGEQDIKHIKSLGYEVVPVVKEL
jgi:hypothetical protein